MKQLDSDFDESDELSRFFMLIKKYNLDQDIEADLQDRIVQYFEYKWEHDENNALCKDEYQKILN
jgi:hypothetical protein